MPWMIAVVGVLSFIAQAAAAEKTKFYRVAEIDGSWWFVQPNGERFFSSGVNVVAPGLPQENYDPTRPAYAAFRHYPDNPSWARTAQQRLKQWGFNTVGGWSAREMTNGPLPYIRVLHIGAQLGVPWNDILDPEFTNQVDGLVREAVQPLAADANLLGWCTDNELQWFSDTLFLHHINQSPRRTTRTALVELLRRHYENDFRCLAADFQSVGAFSFDELEQGGGLRLLPGGQGMKVVNRFTRLIAQHYYQTTHEALRRYDPDHLILGDRYHGYCPDEVVAAAGPYVDVVTTNYDRPDWTNGRLPSHYLQRLHELSNKPILITEYYVAARENRSGNQNTGNAFTTVATQEERAVAARNRLSTFASLPYVVGAHWFQYSDEPTFGRGDGEDYNFGLVDIDDRPYEDLTQAFAEIHADVPALHSGAPTSSDKPTDPIAIPRAFSDSFNGLGNWDTSRAIVRSGRDQPSLADLLACWDDGHLYVALVGSRFVEARFYPEESPLGDTEQLEWRIVVDESPNVFRIRFGIGEEIHVSEPAVSCRLCQHGMRYTVLARIPAERLGRKTFQWGDKLKFNAELVDRRGGTKTSWQRELECGEALRDAQAERNFLPR